MISAPLYPEEKIRIQELLKYEVLDTEDEKAFDELTQLASEICATPISLISLVDNDRQWFKSRVGLDAPQTDRSIAFCSHAILQDDVLEVENATLDERFHDNPLVTGAPDIRFYAGAPLVTPDGYPLGTLCVIDQKEKKLTDFQKRALKTLANQVISQLELRLQARRQERLNKDREKFYAVLAHDIKSPFNGILNLSRIMSENSESMTKEKITQLSTEILNSSVTLYQVIDEILQWSQTRLNQNTVHLEPVNILKAAEETKDLVKDGLRIKGVDLNLKISHDVSVMADEVLLKTVIRNLLMNAIKYTPASSEVVISVEDRGKDFCISVCDQGAGIPRELKSKLFDKAVGSKKGTAGELGHGLGLSLAGDFIRMLKGSIAVDTSYTKGAKVDVILEKAS